MTDISARRAFSEAPAGDAYSRMAAAITEYEEAGQRLGDWIELARDLRQHAAERIGDIPRDALAAHWEAVGQAWNA